MELTDEPKKYPRTFESIDGYTFRLLVPGGWIVVRATGPEQSMLFFSDPRHEWDLEDKKEK